MCDLAILLIHFFTTVTKLVGRGGVCSIVAESLLLKHQLLIVNRPRERAPNSRPIDRLIAGLCAGWLRPARLTRCAIVLKSSDTSYRSRRLRQRRKIDSDSRVQYEYSDASQ
jgi:hypothetical protein